MKSLPKAIAEFPDPSAFLAAGGGVRFAPPLQREPIDAWMDLMEVIECLCPVWPKRTMAVGTDYRL